MKTSPSNTTEPSCCPWPIVGKTPTAHSFLCEWHRVKSKAHRHHLKILGYFDCFYFFFFFCLLSLSLERNSVESDVKMQKKRNFGLILFHPHMLHFFSLAVFCVKFTETLASCSAKVMCLQGCASLSSPDSIYQSLAYIFQYAAGCSVWFG